MARWLSDLADSLPFERRRQPSGPGLGAGGLGLVALAVGASLMYFLDPEAGSGRRAALRTALNDLASRMGVVLDDASRDVARRAQDLGVVRRTMPRTMPPEAQSP
jgi:hypothetical protein